MQNTQAINVKAGSAVATGSVTVSDSMPGVPCPDPAGYKYVGARYVPLFADPAEWSSENTYEPLTIVLYEGNSYTSKQFVPVGIQIDNEEYWAQTGNYNAQVEQYRKVVIELSTKFAKQYEHVNPSMTIDEIQTIMNGNKGVWFESGTYNFNEAKGSSVVYFLNVNNGQRLYFDDCIIQIGALDEGSYNIIQIKEDDVVISGDLTIIGDKNIHTGSAGEYGMGISITNASNVIVTGVKSNNCWGDGIYIGGESSVPTNITIQNCRMNGNRRQGISVCNGENVYLKDLFITNTGGTAPGYAIDVEPYLTTQIVKNVFIDNVTSTNNSGGIGVFTTAVNSGQVFIRDCSVESVNVGIIEECTYNIFVDNVVVSKSCLVRQASDTSHYTANITSTTVNNVLYVEDTTKQVDLCFYLPNKVASIVNLNSGANVQNSSLTILSPMPQTNYGDYRGWDVKGNAFSTVTKTADFTINPNERTFILNLASEANMTLSGLYPTEMEIEFLCTTDNALYIRKSNSPSINAWYYNGKELTEDGFIKMYKGYSKMTYKTIGDKLCAIFEGNVNNA